MEDPRKFLLDALNKGYISYEVVTELCLAYMSDEQLIEMLRAAAIYVSEE